MAYSDSNTTKDIKYTHRDFSGIKNNLIEFAKTYFPKTVKDFTPASPSTMFIDMAAYVGDVLSYYTDYAMKESMLHRATEAKNIYALAQAFGYKPKLASPATVELDVMILVPAIGTGNEIRPNYNYAPKINEGMTVSTTGGIKFHTVDPVDFAASSSINPTDIEVYSTDASTGRPEYYLFTKKVNAISGDKLTTQITTGPEIEYPSYVVNDTDIQSIDSITDSDGLNWTEVPYLAQATVFDESINDVANDPTRSQGNVDSPYILRLKTVNRRYVTRITSNNKIELRFGAGISSDPDEVIIPNPVNVGSNLPGGVNNLDKSFDPSNFLYTSTYGIAPANTTLTVNYTKGYGLASNVQAGTLNNIDAKSAYFGESFSFK